MSGVHTRVRDNRKSAYERSTITADYSVSPLFPLRNRLRRPHTGFTVCWTRSEIEQILRFDFCMSRNSCDPLRVCLGLYIRRFSRSFSTICESTRSTMWYLQRQRDEFCGADHKLRLAFINACKDCTVHDRLASENIQWHFIPAASPHFGGLWEAGVKSFKHHLKRVIGNDTLSQLEFDSLMSDRSFPQLPPFHIMINDPDSLDALTPGHFLIGRSLLSVPEESILDVNKNRLSRWQRVQAMHEHFWKVDRLLAHVSSASKMAKRSIIKANDLTLIKNPLLPPAKWELARVVETHPGHTRVVTVRIKSSTFKGYGHGRIFKKSIFFFFCLNDALSS